MKAIVKLGCFVTLPFLCIAWSPALPDQVLEKPGKTPAKARRIIIPKLAFEDATVQEAIQFLHDQSKRLDPDGEGVNFLLQLDPRVPGTARHTITMEMRNIPLAEAVRYVCMAAGLQYKIEDYAIIIADRSVPMDKMETRFYPVAPGVFGTFRTRKRFKALEHLGNENDNDGGGGNGNSNGQ